MKKVIITDDKSKAELKEKEAPFLEEQQVVFISPSGIQKTLTDEETFAFVYLSDEDIKKIIPQLIDFQIAIGFLPHPASIAVSKGYGVPNDFQKAFNQIIEKPKKMSFDILTCNGTPVLNSVSVGRLMDFITNHPKNIVKRIRSFFTFLRNVSSDYSKLFVIEKDEENKIETVGTDILIVQHAKNVSVSRLLVKENAINPKLFHAFFFSPRSIMQLVSAYLMKAILKGGQRNKTFDFLGHVKDKALNIQFSQPTKVKIDDNIVELEEIKLSTLKNFQFYPSELILKAEVEDESSTKFIVDKLPKGEVKKDIASKRLPLIRHASKEEYKELFNQLRENAKPKQTYIVLMMLSTILATFGLFSNSSPVIIGAMILAPLMSPIISLSMGVLRQDRELMRASLITVGIGIAVGYIFAILITLITPLVDINEEIRLRTNPNIIDLGIAVVSGAAGAYAHSKEEIAKTLAGVAIAVALVPPLAVSGIGIGWWNWPIFFGSFLLLLTNLTGMVLAGSLVFLLSGYSPFRLAKKGILISSFVVLALSIPLGYGFIKVVQENRIIQSINHQVVNEIEIKEVKVVSSSPLELSMNLLSDHTPTEEEIQEIKKEIEKILNREVVLHITISLKK